MEQLNLFSRIYEANTHQKKIVMQYEKGRFSEDNLYLVLSTLDIYIEENIQPPVYFKFILRSYLEKGYKIDRKYMNGDVTMIGKITEWKMTEEERQAYIKKHPIKERKPKGSSFASLDVETQAKGKSKKKKR